LIRASHLAVEHGGLAIVAEGLTKAYPAGKRKTFTAVDHLIL
jgi:hypothetical protein